MSIRDFVSVERHHCGYLVRYPAQAINWDGLTYRERYFESVIGGPRAYDEARRFATETKTNLKKQETEQILRALWERNPPGNGLAKEVAEWEQTLIENGRGGEE